MRQRGRRPEADRVVPPSGVLPGRRPQGDCRHRSGTRRQPLHHANGLRNAAPHEPLLCHRSPGPQAEARRQQHEPFGAHRGTAEEPGQALYRRRFHPLQRRPDRRTRQQHLAHRQRPPEDPHSGHVAGLDPGLRQAPALP